MPRTITQAQKQHVNEYRKYLLRKRLLRWALPGPAYVPFIGDGDLALALYGERIIYGADIDSDRIQTARSRLPPRSELVVADCEQWPFNGLATPLALADFDAYADPYGAFRAFWAEARKQRRLVLFFTDGLKQAIIRTTVPRHTRLDGTVEHIPNEDTNRKRELYHSYFSLQLWPYFLDYVGPGWHVLDRMRYTRASVLYWGVVIERSPNGKASTATQAQARQRQALQGRRRVRAA